MIAENGTHDELMKLSGIYAELYRIQASTPLVDPVNQNTENSDQNKA
ncbi:MAG: hypothetical protein R3A12_02410 [Ignavibacteria bacterium]